MNASELASTLHARRHSGYWMACCPVHGAAGGDKRPSLSIRDGEKGVRLHCFVGCEPREIVRTIGLTFADLGYSSDPQWKQRVKVQVVRSPGARKPLGKLEATYRYTDERGELVAEKQRFEGKVFLWRRPQSGGGWIWKVDRQSLPLYMLHELVNAKACVLTEGEKDVETIRKLGMAATTAPNGAKSWRPEFSQWFAASGSGFFPIPTFQGGNMPILRLRLFFP